MTAVDQTRLDPTDEGNADPDGEPEVVQGDESLDVDGLPIARGQSVGRYLVLMRSGHGGMGVVYSAFDPELDRRVALKILRPRGREDKARARQVRLLREAQALARLSHPNVVAVHDVGTTGGQVFVAMEYVDGETVGQWLARRRPGWRAVLRVFLDAGRGLAAAHAAGLVHRDFKPDNVMIDREGRVRVTDFGIARAMHSGSSTGGEAPAAELTATGAPRVEDRLTRTGSLMGTPAYMAPELHGGKASDPRTDQFAFCVGLWEGLYGERPFDARDLPTLREQLARADLPTPRTGPRWLYRAVARGLAPRPSDRWPSMDALLDALTSAPTRIARRRLVVGGAVVMGGAVAFGLAMAGPPAVCAGAAEQGASVWNDDRRAAVREGLVATRASFARGTAERSVSLLDDYLRAWTEQRVDACEATHVRHEQSQRLLDRRIACLDRRLEGVDALVGVLEDADVDVAASAVEAVARLPPLSPCGDASALLARVEPPADPQTATRVGELRRELAEVAALDAAGRYEAAATLASRLAPAVTELGYAPLSAEHALALGQSHSRQGRAQPAADSLRAAYFAARKSGHAEVAARSATALVDVEGLSLADPVEGREWAMHAEAELSRLDAPRLEARRLVALGRLETSQHQHDAALQALQAAQALQERSRGDGPLALASTRAAIARLHFDRGDFDSAREVFDAVLEARRRTLGPEHPVVAETLERVATVHLAASEFDTAIATHREALTLLERALGPEHPKVAGTQAHLAISLFMRGDLEGARALHERALATRQRVLAPGHPEIAASHSGLGNVLQLMGRIEDALGHYQAAKAIWQQSAGPDSREVARVLHHIGYALTSMDRAREALAPLERSLEIRRAAGEPLETAESAFALARALSGLDETARERAGVLLGEARRQGKAAQRLGAGTEGMLAAIERWADEHRLAVPLDPGG